MKKSLWLFALVLILVALTAIFARPQDQGSQNTNENENLSVDIHFQFDNDNSFFINYPYSNDDSLLSITENIASGQNWTFSYEDYGEMGVLINDINGYENGQEQKYWQYFVGDEQPQISADKYFITDNTPIYWKFQKSQF